MMLVTSRQGGWERRFYVGYYREVDGSTPTLASLLRPLIKCFTIIIPVW